MHMERTRHRLRDEPSFPAFTRGHVAHFVGAWAMHLSCNVSCWVDANRQPIA
jgi:hypothetical protein